MTTPPHEPVTPNPDGTLRFSDGSELKVTERDRPQDWTEDLRRTAENEYKNDYHRRLMANQCTECGWTRGAHAEHCSHHPEAEPETFAEAIANMRIPYYDAWAEGYEAGKKEAWRYGHDNSCNVRVAFPSTEEDCNCHSPAAPNEIERQMSEEPMPEWKKHMPGHWEDVEDLKAKVESQGRIIDRLRDMVRRLESDEPYEQPMPVDEIAGLFADQLEKPIEASEPHGLPEHLEDLKAKLAAERAKVQRLQDTVRGFEIAEPKPPRIRTLELPGEINPDTHELAVNFAIILDRMGDATIEGESLRQLRDASGARTVVCFPFEIQIGEDN